MLHRHVNTIASMHIYSTCSCKCPDSLPGRLESLRVTASHGSAPSAPFYFLLILYMTRLGEGVPKH